MEKRFCGKCGKPIAMCTCDDTSSKMKKADFSKERSVGESVEHTSEYFRRKFDKIVLGDGEEVVRQYHIGTMNKGWFKSSSKSLGDSYVLVTNKRVISKADFENGGSSGTCLEEMSIECISGVKSQYTHDIVWWKVLLGIVLIIAAIASIISMISTWRWTAIIKKIISIFWAVVFGFIGANSLRTCKKPGYLFSIYSSATGEALVMGAGGDSKGLLNAIFSLLNPQNTSILLKYAPTKEAVTMMRELGACIMDIKAKGDYAVEIWKK